MSKQVKDDAAYRPDIDGLRAIAISSVVAFHAFPKFLTGGFLGVDVFFVISGFLIAGIILREQAEGTFKISRFYQRRVRRIFPALIVVLLACLCMGMISLFDVEFLQLARHAFFGAFGLANLSLSKDTSYFSLAAETNPLLHLWSLGVEEQFYLLIPPLVMILGGRKHYLLAAFLAILAGSLWLSVDPFSSADAASKFYLPQYRAWELMAGVLLAYAGRVSVSGGSPLLRREFSNASSAIGMGLLFFAFLYFDSKSPQWLANGTVVVGTVLLIAAGARSGINRYALSLSPVVFVGIISYPLYLWHWPMLVFGRLIVPEGGMLTSIGLVAASVMLAFLTWKFVEKPVRSGQQALFSPARLTVAMLCVAGLAGFVFVQDGRIGWANETSPRAFRSVEVRRADWAEKASSLVFLTPEDEDKGDRQCIKRYWVEGEQDGVQTFCSNHSPMASPSVVVIGDSHAAHLYEGIKGYYTGKGKDVLALAVPGCLLSSEPPVSRRCADAYHRIFEKAADLKSAHTVVLGEYVPYMVSDNRPHWVSTTRERIGSLTAQGKKVVLMLDVPGIDKNPRQYCYSRPPLRSFGNVEEQCSISRRDYEKKVAQYRGNAAEAVKGLEGVRLFDLANVLCTKKTCRGNIDGQVMYRDDNHLNYFGAHYVSQFFDWEK